MSEDRRQRRRRVVITGLSAVTASGTGCEPLWNDLLAGRSRYSTIDAFDTTGFPVRQAGVVRDYDPRATIHGRIVNQTDLHTHFGLTAAALALHDSGLDLDAVDRGLVGTVIGNNLGGNVFGEEQLYNLYTKGARTVSAYQAIAWFYAATTGQVSINNKLRGYAKAYVADRVASMLAIGDAFRVVQRGENDVVVAGGCEAPITPYSIVAYLDAAMLSRTDGADAYRPFDVERDGLLLGEGGAIVVLEEREHALRRGAQIYAEVVGYGQSNDARGPKAYEPEGIQYARAIRLAMSDGDVAPADVGYVSVDGAGGEIEDRREAAALRNALGPTVDDILVSCPKTMFGHTIGAASAIDTLIACLALRDCKVPPTVGTHNLDPACELPLVLGQPARLSRPVALVLATARGGINAALALRASGASSD
jgi:3-oxoacyl-(acyl-carrier-protein) synthase